MWSAQSYKPIKVEFTVTKIVVLRVTYYTIFCGSVKALIPKILVVCCSANYIHVIQTSARETTYCSYCDNGMRRKRELKSWDLHIILQFDSGLLVFKANKLYLQWKNDLVYL